MIGETRFQVNARLDGDGEPAITVVALCDYGSRTAAVTQDVTDEKLLSQVKAIFEKAIRQTRDELHGQATAAAAESFVVATRKGEQL